MRFRTILVANSELLARIYRCLTRHQSRYLGLPLALTCFNLKRRNLTANSPLQVNLLARGVAISNLEIGGKEDFALLGSLFTLKLKR